MNYRCVVLILFVAIQCVLRTDAADQPLNIFIIPHSHCDPGWLNTFQGYFNEYVNTILTNVMNELATDAKKRFIWAEISFFTLWYDRQSQDVRAAVADLVRKGQLEFVAGGWVQNDEANANFDIVIDQVSEGHAFLHRAFGVVPRIAWQIDPFGHSSLTPSLFARMGFEALVINRIHFELKATLKNARQMEFLWDGSRSLASNTSAIFTHVLHTHYSAPQGYDWEEGSPGISSHNVDQRSEDLCRSMKDRSRAYRTNNLMVAFGDDFKFRNARTQFANMDQIIEHMNKNSAKFGCRIQYATTSEYFDAVRASDKTTTYPLYEGDFFPYADNHDAYWTGYYTTRPTLKAHSRESNSLLRTTEVFYAFARPNLTSSSIFPRILAARQDNALVQHHDGITGTARGFVASDYAARLNRGKKDCAAILKDSVKVLLKTSQDEDKVAFELAQVDTSFNINEDTDVALVVVNSLGWVRRSYIRVEVSSYNCEIVSEDGSIVNAQYTPIWSSDSFEDGRIEENRFYVYFLATAPALGARTYFLRSAKSPHSNPLPSEHETYVFNILDDVSKKLGSEPMFLQNENLQVHLSNETGFIHSIYNRDSGFNVNVNQKIYDYSTYKSGAYLFRPINEQEVYPDSTAKRIRVIKGPLIDEAHIFFYKDRQNGAKPETTIVVRLYSSRGIESSQILEVGGFVEVNYNVRGRGNQETVARYYTDIKNNGAFFTDNGLEIRQRSRTGQTEKDYYPSLSLAYLQDTEKSIQFSIVSRHAMGASSKGDGILEQMMHRNLLQDDGRGLAEANRDDSEHKFIVWMLVQPMETSIRSLRKLALSLDNPPRLLHASGERLSKEWTNSYKWSYSPLTKPLPSNVHVFSLKVRDSASDDVIIRLGHTFEKGQHSQLSKPAEVSWDTLFNNMDVTFVRERALAGSLDIDQAYARRPKFAQTDEKLKHASGLPPNFTRGVSQNTDEEGVFISKVALEEKKRMQEEEEKERLKEPLAVPGQRKLLAFEGFVPDLRDSFTLEPMAIRTFFTQLSARRSFSNNANIQNDPASKITKARPDVEPPIKPKDGGNGGIPAEDAEGVDQPPQPPPPRKSSPKPEKVSAAGGFSIVLPEPDILLGNIERTSFVMLSAVCMGLVYAAYVRLQRGKSTLKRKDSLV